jgi:hypothetical protein
VCVLCICKQCAYCAYASSVRIVHMQAVCVLCICKQCAYCAYASSVRIVRIASSVCVLQAVSVLSWSLSCLAGHFTISHRYFPNTDRNIPLQVALCAEGSSLVPLMKDPSKPIKTASFSQYPRGYQHPHRQHPHALSDDAPNEGIGMYGYGATPSTSTCIIDTFPTGKPSPRCTMGYTLVTTAGGHEYR